MPEFKNAILLAADAALYFAALAALFRYRHKLGIGAFFCALGVMHFIETYLAAVFYVSIPFGAVASPGSAVLFSGKLMLLLLVYIREDAALVRQPIYGLLFGNLLMVALAALLRQHDLVPLGAGRVADFGFLTEMGALMVWGTLLLFVDCILIILVYERLRTTFAHNMVLRLALSGAAVLTFDQIGFFAGLHWLTGAPPSVLAGGWAAKMAAVALFAPLVALYLRVMERGEEGEQARHISDVFQTLTYRERYEDLMARSGRDALTGAFDRWRLETQGRRMINDAAGRRRKTSLMLIDIDHFKEFNDQLGHAAGDVALRRIAGVIMATVREEDLVFRFGGEEFVVIGEGLNAAQALALGDRLQREIANARCARPVTASIGIATCDDDATDYDALFSIADHRLYQAKAQGRDRVVGEIAPPLQLAMTA